jgi:Reverse transcriptase (RNA-dependent DNA polymerase)
LFGKGVTWGFFSVDIWEECENIIMKYNSFLTASFTEDEIHIAIFSMALDKVAGPEGFSIRFYQCFWDLIKNDLLLLFDDFHNGTLDISKLNRTSVFLIPKVKNPSLVTEYRPISLLNYSYKTFSKVLATCLQSIFSKIIGPQLAFLKRYYILEGVVLAHEILHHVHLSKKPDILLKVDFQKVFYYVNWNYLVSYFRQMNFSGKWISWISKLL